METKKTEIVGLRLSPRYKNYLERMASARKQSVQELLIEFIRKEMKPQLRSFAYFEAIEATAEEFEITDFMTGYMLATNDKFFVDEKIKDGTISEDNYAKFSKRLKTVYSETVKSASEEFGYDLNE